MTQALKALQKRIGVKPDGAFGPKTAKAIAQHFSLTPTQAAHFLGQVYHESAGMRLTEENLHYRASTICRVWKKRFPTLEDAEPYAGNPRKLANKTYGGRMGNTAEGDGWRYRGRGFIQLTGKNNYRAFANSIGRDDVLDKPDIVAGELAMESALFYFTKNGLFDAMPDVSMATIKNITRRVNGGHHGLKERAAWTTKIYSWLA